MKLNLGCGSPWKRNGWTGLEIHRGYDLNEKLLKEFKTDSAELIYFSHCMEHLPWSTIPLIMKECYRVLQPKGTIRFVVPDMDIVANILIYDDKEYLMAGNPHFYKSASHRDRPLIKDIEQQIGFTGSGFLNDLNDSHKSFFTFSIMNILLRIAGFKNISRDSFCESSIEEMKEEAILHPGGMPQSGFDNTMVKNISLYVEAIKD